MTFHTISFRKEKRKQVVETCRNKKSIDIAKTYIKCQKPQNNTNSFNILLHYTTCDKYILVKLDETNNVPVKVWSNANGILPTQYTLIKKDIFVKLVEKIKPKIIYLNDSRLLLPLFQKSHSMICSDTENNNCSTKTSKLDGFDIRKSRLIAYQNKNLTEILKSIENDKKLIDNSNQRDKSIIKIIDQINKTINAQNKIQLSSSISLPSIAPLKSSTTTNKLLINKQIIEKPHCNTQPKIHNKNNNYNNNNQSSTNTLCGDNDDTDTIMNKNIINDQTLMEKIIKNNKKPSAITKNELCDENNNLKQDLNCVDTTENKNKRKCRKNRRKKRSSALKNN